MNFIFTDEVLISYGLRRRFRSFSLSCMILSTIVWPGYAKSRQIEICLILQVESNLPRCRSLVIFEKWTLTTRRNQANIIRLHMSFLWTICFEWKSKHTKIDVDGVTDLPVGTRGPFEYEYTSWTKLFFSTIDSLNNPGVLCAIVETFDAVFWSWKFVVLAFGSAK